MVPYHGSRRLPAAAGVYWRVAPTLEPSPIFKATRARNPDSVGSIAAKGSA
jgi:hypothetical protein